MAVKEVMLAGNPILRKKAEEIENYSSEKELVNDLKETLIYLKEKHGLGRGLAAPQIGVLKRVLYIISDEFTGELINPRIASHGSKESVWWDSCFSYNAAVFSKVKRWEEIEVEYFDLEGNKKTIKTSGLLSELLQHEIDHLDGILFVDRMIEQKELIIMKEEWKKLGKPD